MVLYKQNEEAYEEVVEDGLDTFQGIVELYLLGRITLAALRTQFKAALRMHYARLMLAALEDTDPTDSQLDELNRRIEAQNILLEGFLADLAAETITPNRALWRAGMYAPDRGAFIYYTVPSSVASLMPGLPGDICLGDGLCGCYLDISFDDAGNASVDWVVDPIKEHCEVCLEMESNSPFVFTAEQLENA